MEGANEHPLFYINKDGLPLSDENIDKMKNFCLDKVAKHDNYRDKIETLFKADYPKTGPNPPKPPLQQANSFKNTTDIITHISSVQCYFKSLGYNHTGMQFFDIRKSRSVCRLVDVCKDMINFSLPIKCLEAVILGIYLTTVCPESLVRFTLSFKSKSKTTRTSHYHVLLGLYIHGIGYGCIGQSRRESLAYKTLGKFTSLNDLIADIKNSYENEGHILKRVSIGMPIIHDNCSLEQITWDGIVLDLRKTSAEDISKKLEKFSKLFRLQHK